MYKYQNHIEMLEAIQEMRDKLPASQDSFSGRIKAMETLAMLYACLDVSELKQIVNDFKHMDRRAKLRMPGYKKAA